MTTVVSTALIVKSRATKESHPAAFVNVHDGVVVDEVYVTPSIQVNESQADCVSVKVVEFEIVKSSVTKESHPAAFVSIHVGVFVDDEYITPSIQVNESQAVWKSVELLFEMVRKIVRRLSHPCVFGIVSLYMPDTVYVSSPEGTV